MRLFLPTRPLFKAWLLSFLGFGLLALAIDEQLVASSAATWLQAARFSLEDWLPWALFTPLLFRLVAWLPLEQRRWFIGLPVHVLCCSVTLLACNQWSKVVDSYFESRWAEGPPMRELYGRAGIPAASPALPAPPHDLPARTSNAAFGLIRIVGFYLPIYIAIVSVMHALHFYRDSEERAASLTLARLETLKMQLHPHFLFNTLNMTAELVHTEPERADAMLTALSEMLRLTIKNSGTRIVPLRREIEFIEHYLAIMHARFEDRVGVKFDIAPGTEVALVPTLALQPLVENAVEHGLKDCPTAGLITISARLEGAMLHLSVADNGLGLRDSKPLREGVGIRNTRARLKELYGNAARFELRDCGGVIAEMTLPFRPAS